MVTQLVIRTGTLVRWFQDRGFGFIAPAIAGQDVFVHRLDIIGEIPLKSLVQYELVPFNGKMKAVRVRAIECEGASNES